MLVPQEGFLFDDTLAANVRYGRLDATDDDILAAADELGLGDWLAGLPRGPRRPRSASAASRCRRASGSWSRCSAPTSPTPTCWSSTRPRSAVDPQLEMRIGRALERLMSGRTSVTIAHRLSTAENADEVVVVDRGRDRPARPARRAGRASRRRLRRPARARGSPSRVAIRLRDWSA